MEGLLVEIVGTPLSNHLNSGSCVLYLIFLIFDGLTKSEFRYTISSQMNSSLTNFIRLSKFNIDVKVW